MRIALSFLLLAGALASYNVFAGARAHVPQPAVTPIHALRMLQQGNERFRAGKMLHRNLPERVHATAAHQHPFAAVVCCMDSRTPPELVFDQGIGDIFGIRVAGNVINGDVLGSLEYAAKITGVKAIVVMGHTQCGAVKGACDGLTMGNLTDLLAKITPAIAAVPPGVQPRTSKNPAFVNAAAEMNVKLAIDEIMKTSRIVRELVEAKKIALAGAMYDVATGNVKFLR